MDMAQDLALTVPPPPMQRARGLGVLSCGLSAGRTRPITLRQEGCAKIRLLPSRDGFLDALMVNTAGGLTGGDHVRWRASVHAGARASLSTTSCERIYRSAGGAARIDVALDVGAGAALDWIPQETILFDRARLSRTLDADVAADGRLLIAESVLLGRRAMGETAISGAIAERWRVRRCGGLIFADDIRIGAALSDAAARPAALNGGAAYAALLLVAPDAECFLAPLRAAIGDTGGASAFDGRLFCRMVAPDGFALRRALLPALKVLSPGVESQRVWSF